MKSKCAAVWAVPAVQPRRREQISLRLISRSSEGEGGDTEQACGTSDETDSIIGGGEGDCRASGPGSVVPMPGQDLGARIETHLVYVPAGLLGLEPLSSEVISDTVLVSGRTGSTGHLLSELDLKLVLGIGVHRQSGCGWRKCWHIRYKL